MGPHAFVLFHLTILSLFSIRESRIKNNAFSSFRQIFSLQKAGLRTKAKSLQQYILKYAPKTALMLSEKNFSTKDSVRRSIPLYYAGNLKQLV
jgi:hypothetical protein